MPAAVTTVLRPNNTIASYGVTATGGSINAVLADNSDSTYIQPTVQNAFAHITFGDLTLTSTQRIKDVYMSVRTAHAPTGPTLQYVTCRMADENGRVGGVVGAFTVQRGITSVLTSVGPKALTGPSAKAWDDLHTGSLSPTTFSVNETMVALNWPLDANKGAFFLRTHELYMSVDIFEQPVVTGTPTVTGNTTTTRPTVAWQYFDLDGEPQASFQVRVFDSATYGATGFSADTSTPAYDSGPLTGSGLTHILTNDLQNGTTYKAYVRVGTGGWGGGIWYSAWKPSAAFTITLVPPVQPTISGNIWYDGHSLRAILLPVTPLNLLAGDASNFETSTGGWLVDANVALAWITTDHAEGSGSMTMTASAAGAMSAKSPFDAGGDPRVDGGQTYTALASVKAAATARSVQVGIRWLDITGAAASSDVYGTTIVDNTSTWTQGFLTAVAPLNAVQARVLVKVSGAASAEVHKVDMADIHVGTGTTWTPGFYLSQSPGVVVERGERLDRRRGPAENWAHPVVATAGEALSDSGYGFAWDATKDVVTFEYLNNSGLPSIMGNVSSDGGLHWQPRTTGAVTLTIGSWLYAPDTDWNFPVIPGSVHIFSMWAWADATFLTTPKVQWLAEDGSIITQTTIAQQTVTTSASRISFTATPPTGSVGARVTLANDGLTASADVWIARIGWGLGTIPVDDRRPRGGPLVWTTVRVGDSATPLLPPTSGTTGNDPQIDTEITPGRPTMWRTRIITTTPAGNTITSPYSKYATALVPLPTTSIMRGTSLQNRRLSVAINRRPDSSFSRVEDAQIFHPLGRDASPVKVTDWVGGDDGQIVVVTSTETQEALLAELLAANEVYFIQWAHGGSSYVIVTEHGNAEVLGQTGWCDAAGIPQPRVRLQAHSLTYLETGVP